MDLDRGANNFPGEITTSHDVVAGKGKSYRKGRQGFRKGRKEILTIPIVGISLDFSLRPFRPLRLSALLLHDRTACIPNRERHCCPDQYVPGPRHTGVQPDI